ncbi:MAG: Segregation and condensation protein B [Parcubacteria group bacterium GW2011_GWA1_51_12]|nr:MAG: Segregation and condensation protein B [Parcubacteria group bacterium GW2011_GWA1_51_12]
MTLALKFKIEAMLFVSGEPMTIERIAKILGEKPANVKEALSELATDYKDRGLCIVENGQDWQFGTAAGASDVIEKLVKSEFTEELSKAAMEVLSIIAYKGPLTRAEIEYIRGVNSSYSLRNLLLRGLIERIDNPKDARSYLYRISVEFLKYLGVKNREALPEWESFRKAVIPNLNNEEAPDNSDSQK